MVCSKVGAGLILRALLGLEIDASHVPIQSDDFQDSDTVVEAQAVWATADVQIEVDII